MHQCDATHGSMCRATHPRSERGAWQSLQQKLVMRGVFGILWQIIVLDPVSETLAARELSPAPMVAERDLEGPEQCGESHRQGGVE